MSEVMDVGLTQEDMARCESIASWVPGYSLLLHYAFFKTLLAEHPTIKTMLVLGVYHGRDLAYLLDLLATYHQDREIEIIGVDRFTDAACGDWPDEKKHLTWEEAGYGAAPSLADAQYNLSKFRNAHMVELVQMDDQAFLETTGRKFDCLYFDTSHDANSVTRQLKAAPRVASQPDTLLCGDDFRPVMLTWGVDKAVKAAFTGYRVYGDWIWLSAVKHLKP